MGRSWVAVASSADGTRLVGAELEGPIYTSVQATNTTTGTAGFINGDQYEAIALQYIGNDVFIVISYAGAVTVN